VDPERPGEILGSQKTIVLGFMHMVLGLEGLRRPGETRRDFGLPKNHCLRLHAYVGVGGTQATRTDRERFWAPKQPLFEAGNCLRMMNPCSDFGLDGRRRPGVSWRDFGLQKTNCWRLHAWVSMVKLPENDESGFKRLFGGTKDTWRDLARFRVKKKETAVQCLLSI
jgi:hypothetical protein